MKSKVETEGNLEGYLLASANARSLYRMAEVVASENEYGIASSLNILSAEESIKALSIAIKHYRPFVEQDDYDKLFRSHPTKHLHIQWLTVAYEFMVTYWQKLFGDELNEGEFLDEDFPDQKSRSALLKIIKAVREHNSQPHDFEQALIWWERANNEKNSGFYVDYRNGKWTRPQSKTEKEFKIEAGYSKLIMECMEVTVAMLEMTPAMEAEATYRLLEEKAYGVTITNPIDAKQD